jgi:hypothetical protein
MKPFRFGVVVPAEFQCPRPALLKTMLSHLRDGERVLLLGERRMGKTSFICHAVAPALKQRLFMVSLWGVKSADELAAQVRAALVRLRRESPVFQKARRFLATRVTAGIDIGMLAAQSLPGDSENPAILEQLLDELYAEHQSSPVLAVWDEFQEILKLPDGNALIGRLRNSIQHFSGMAHVFAGSDRNRMHGIFNDPASPFYKGAATIVLDRIDTREFAAWIRKRFARSGITVADELMESIFKMTSSVSGDVQQLCSALWIVAGQGEKLGNRHMDLALREIWAGESRSYEATMEEATAIQWRCLKALALYPGKPVAGAEFVKLAGVGAPSSVARALNGLVARNVLNKSAAAYVFINPFFKEWIKNSVRSDQSV